MQIDDNEILRKSAVIKLTGRSAVTLWRDVRAGRFPAPLQLGPNAIGWRGRDINEWLASRPRVAYAPKTGTGDVRAA